jgi:hypothetical protein
LQSVTRGNINHSDFLAHDPLALSFSLLVPH